MHTTEITIVINSRSALGQMEWDTIDEAVESMQIADDWKITHKEAVRTVWSKEKLG